MSPSGVSSIAKKPSTASGWPRRQRFRSSAATGIQGKELWPTGSGCRPARRCRPKASRSPPIVAHATPSPWGRKAVGSARSAKSPETGSRGLRPEHTCKLALPHLRLRTSKVPRITPRWLSNRAGRDRARRSAADILARGIRPALSAIYLLWQIMADCQAQKRMRICSAPPPRSQLPVTA